LAATFDDAHARQALQLHERFAADFVNARLPAWFNYLWCTVRLVAPIKGNHHDRSPDVRPLGIGEPRRVAPVSQVMDDWKSRAADHLWPQQVAIGIRSGIQLLGVGLKLALECHPGWALLKLDFHNAFNEMKRAAILRSIQTGYDGDFRDLYPLFRVQLVPRSSIILGDRAKSRAGFDSEEGVQQGSGEGPMGFCLGLHEDLVWADSRLAAHGGCAKGDMDDIYMFGPIHEVLETALGFADRLQDRAGIALNLGKSAVHSIDPARDASILAGNPVYARTFKVGCLSSVDVASAPYGSGYGIVVSGVPVGDAVFVDRHIDVKVDVALEQIQNSVSQLRDAHRQSLWTVLLFCLRPKLDFLAQTCHGAHANAAFQRFDAAVLSAAGAAAGQSLARLDPFRLRRLALPARLFGCGMRRLAAVAPAALVGTLCRVLPPMIDSWSDGQVRPGFLHAQLQATLGADSFAAGAEATRFDRFLRSDCSLASALRDGWDSLVSSATAACGGQSPTDGALSVPVSAAGVVDGSLASKPQNAFTAAVELAWYEALDAGFKSLPSEDPARTAWLNVDRFSTQWVTALPSPTLGLVLGNDAFSEVFATYLALPSPACAPLVGQRIGRYRDVLDTHGTKLSTLSLPGDGWRMRHDTVKHLIDRDIQDHGVPCSCEVFGLFSALLPQPGQAATAALPARKRQGLVPDFRITQPSGDEALMELKLIAGPTWYHHGDVSRCPAVARRARAIPGEYADKAKALDAQFCGVPRGADSIGPVLHKLLSYGRMRCLVFGAYGEGSADAHELVAQLAACRGARDWARLGCRSPSDAVALLARHLYRSWGLAVVRAQACLRLGGLAHVGPGASAATGRRAANAAFYARLREAYQLQHRGGYGRTRLR